MGEIRNHMLSVKSVKCARQRTYDSGAELDSGHISFLNTHIRRSVVFKLPLRVSSVSAVSALDISQGSTETDSMETSIRIATTHQLFIFISNTLPGIHQRWPCRQYDGLANRPVIV